MHIHEAVLASTSFALSGNELAARMQLAK